MVIEDIVLEAIPEDSYCSFVWYFLWLSLMSMIFGIGVALVVSNFAFLNPLLSFLVAVVAGGLILGFPNIFIN